MSAVNAFEIGRGEDVWIKLFLPASLDHCNALWQQGANGV